MDESFAAGTGAFAGRLSPLSGPERHRLALDLVCTAAAAVLAQIMPDEAPAVEPGRPFRDLGLDSMGLVALQSRLSAATGLPLPPTVGFDFPTPELLAGHLVALATGAGEDDAEWAAGPAAADEPIVIVGVGCRYPGGVHSPEQLGDLVADGRHVLGDFPADRGWDLDRLYHPDPDRPGSMYVRHGGFLPDAADFDAGFFGISPREAQAMDPQQRLVLETVWEAIERAGIEADTLRGSRSGVFIGAEAQEYGMRLHEAPDGLDGYLMTGNAPSVISGRVAYTMGLRGPALTIDTACSSSLVALHLAVQSLRRGESDLAIAGGAAVMAGPGTFTSFSRQRGLAPDGRCKPFAAAADGTGFAEGVGVLVLERLSDARRLGHPVLAVVRGSAVNQDGASNGLTAPNGPAQRQVIRQALTDAGLAAGDVDVVEAHGTGTTLGDPIEAQAVIATYGPGHSPEQPLLLGSIKSNLGHTQAAAGAAGIIKLIEAMRREVLPPTLHVDQPTPHVDWSAGTVRLAVDAVPWPAGDRPRRAAVSSFGVSGTNAHVIIEEPPAAPAAEVVTPGFRPAGTPVPLVVTARDETALRAQAERLLTALDEPVALDDLGFSLGTTRTKLDVRAVVLATDPDAARQGLRAVADGTELPSVLRGTLPAGRLAVLFTGQGSQRLDMGRELAETYPVFRDALADAIAALDVHLDVSLWDVLFAAAGSEAAALLDRTEYTQAALFAVETALYRLVTAWGVRPDYLAGHSVGELVAAHVAGVLDLDDAAMLVAARGRLMGALPAGGVMVAVAAPEATVRPLLTDGVDIAAVNGPGSVVLSGTEEAVLALAGRMNVRTTRLNTSHAFHSHLMEPMLAEFAEIAEVLDYRAPQLAVISNVTGQPATAEQLCDPAYWVGHVRACVRFADGIATLAEAGVTTFLELGPDAVLSGMGARCVDGEARFVPALRRGRPEAAELVAAIGAVHAHGTPVDWAAFFAGRGARRITLPTYAFQRRSYWLHAPAATDTAELGQADANHPLLGAVVHLAGGGVVLTGRLSTRTQPWLADHVVGGAVLVPGTALVELAVRAGDEVGCARLEELTLQRPLVLPAAGAAIDVQVVVGEEDTGGARTVEIHARPAATGTETWILHAAGTLAPAGAAPETAGDAWPPAGADPIPVGDLYAELTAAGYGYGPAFQGLRAAWRRDRTVFAEVALPEAVAGADAFGLHPALLDAVLHATDFATGATLDGATRLPFAWTDVTLHRSGAAAVRATITATGDDAVAIELADPAGRPVAGIGSFVARAVGADRLGPATAGALYRVDRQPVAVPADTPAGRTYRGFDTLRAALSAGDRFPGWVAVTAPPATGDVLADLHEQTGALLGLLTAWLTGDAVADTRLVVVTDGTADLVEGALTGLVRTAQAENPGRFQLVALPGGDPALLAAAVATGEPEVAVRDGRVLAARLAAVEPAEPATDPWGGGTVLITGGTGGLGALVAEHLARAHGVPDLVLTSRRGAAAPGAEALRDRLAGLGVSVRIVACDVADRTAVARLIGEIGDRLTGVVHTAGVVADGLLGSLTRESLDTVLAAKTDGAWHLHELTAGLPLSAFVLFSSAAGTLDGAGQGNYAAANAALDALAGLRHAAGLPATALAWGLWTGDAGMGSQLTAADLQRVERSGLAPLSPEENLALLDLAVAGRVTAALPLRLDHAALRERGDELPAMLRGLIRTPVRRATATGANAAPQQGELARRLAQLPPADRPAALLDLVRTHVAAVLGFDDPAAVDPRRAFQQIGFDSLASVELRNRLSAATGLRLPATLTFDYPSARALAEHLRERVLPSAEPAAVAAAASSAGSTVADAGEPIAIVGMACRFPGGVETPEDLWRLVADGADGITRFPENRGWDTEGIFDPEPGKPGKTYSNEGGFLHDAAEFDPALFGISPREAQAMDPQQRLLLEVAWEAVERAGIDPQALRGSRTGVFAGVMYHDWATRLGEVPEELAGYLGNGSLASVVSGRVAYVLGLEGPAVTVDTACSSSLVALHWAIQAVRQGDCSLALAGGVTVMATPDTFTDFSRQRGLAADGRCKSFADAADGTGWGEGAGMLLVERLSDAVAAGHPVLAVIRGSAVNQDGASNGLTAPNGPSQQRVIRAALAGARLDPADVDVVEAHGTGTTLGDPIEAQALLATYGQDRPADRPLLLGSIKSNIGHTQAAAGVAGIIKMVQAIRHGVVPKTLHVDEPSTKVDWADGDVRLLTEAVGWPAVERPRRAGVSSFGISGTNAHVIIEQAPAVDVPAPAPLDGPVPWLLSGHTPAAVRGQADRLLAHLAAHGEVDLAAAARTLATGRAALEHRAAVVASTEVEFADGLAAITTGEVAPGKLAILFTGQGSQRLGMGQDLYERYPVFAAAFDAAGAAVKDVVWGSDAELLAQTANTQPAIFAFEVALYRLLESWGVRPDYLAGHSIGEIAAAHVAGVLSLQDAARLVTTRGRLMQALPAGGVMVAVAAPESAIELIPGVDIAAVNGPRSVVLSGLPDAVEAVVAKLGVKATKLNTSHAFHSPLMEPMLDEFEAFTRTLDYSEPTIPVVVVGDVTDPGYWADHVRDAVRFADVVEDLVERGVTTFLEVGPDSTLTGLGRQITDDATFLGLQHRTRPAQLLTGLAAAWIRGAEVDWAAVLGDGPRADLPTYAFQRETFWLDAAAPAGGDVRQAGLGATDHPMLSAVVVAADGGGVTLTGRLALGAQRWTGDHVVLGSVLLPGTGFVELALRAADEVGCGLLEELTLEAPLILPARGGVAVQVTAGAPDTAGRRPFAAWTRPEDTPDAPWTRHAVGFLAPGTPTSADSLTEWPPPGATALPVDGAYQRLAGRGYGYGPTFQGLRAAWRRGEELFAEVALPPEAHADAARFGLHPALLDTAMHADLLQEDADDTGDTLLPFAWTGVTLHAAGATALRVRVRRIRGAEVSSMLVADGTGAPVMSVERLVSRPVSADRLAAPAPGADGLFAVEWRPAPDVSGTAVPETVVLRSPDGPDLPARTRAAVTEALGVLQDRLAGDRTAPLVVVTRSAVSAGDEDPDVVSAPVWGLVRAAQAENPGRFVLLDTDRDVPDELLARALATGEPELAVRDGDLLVPRLAPAPAAEPVTWTADDTVLITGGTGGIGALLAEHLVRQGAGRLVLTSRRGPDAPGAAELAGRLTALGATVHVVACDATDRAALAACLETYGDTLTAVVHAAGISDNALTADLTANRVHAVLAPKVDAGWHLHELTARLPLKAFVLFSSAGGLVLAAGQGNYAAANVFLDALAQHRRARHLPATAVAYGLWAEQTGLGGAITAADLDRMRRLGTPAIGTADALALFDRALGSGLPLAVALPVDRAALAARGADLPALLRGLVRTPARRVAAAAGETTGNPLEQRLAGLDEAAREKVVLDLVRGHVATVLGHASADAVAADKAFKELGFDSLAAVELRNALNTATGLRLPATLVFDHPTSRAVAEVVRESLGGRKTTASPQTTAPTAARTGDPIAIVGMTCRYPGGVSSPEDLWRLVADGVDAVGAFPGDRGWDVGKVYDPEPGLPGKTYSRDGAFLYDAADFDAAFFGISPREAQAMDPQQRLLLETAWETFERAGIDPVAMHGTQTGVYVGVMYHDYGSWLREVPDDMAGYVGNGNAGSILSGRVAYALGLEGPAVSVDTACSSSLVALHMATQALASGEVSMALAGGVTVMSTPEIFIEFSQQRGLSPDGRCKSFAGAADGTGWGEGVGLLLLERLSDAERHGHEVLAVIRGSAINQDGASNGLTAPNGPSQQRVIRTGLERAGLTTADVDVVEAHGTGTRLGDPIEAQALLATYGQDRPADRPLLLGSIKSNIGHTQAAAGVAGVIKMVQAMRHGMVPKTLHVDQPSPVVDWSAGHVRLITEAVAWPAVDRPRRAAVSSFGLSGTNAHVIVEQAAEKPITPQISGTPEGPFPIAVSARTVAALDAQTDRMASALGAPLDVAFSSFTTRAALDHRRILLGDKRITGTVTPGSTAVLFTGQGSQRLGMGRDLYERYPVFAAAFDAAGSAVKDIVWGSSFDELAKTVNTQPAIFAFEVALYRLLESWGVRPDYLAGHSIGEIAAAHVAGVLTLADAARLVAARGRLMQALPAGGVMVAVAASAESIELIPGVDIAAVNGPNSVVLSGVESAVLSLVDRLGVKSTRLNTSHAFHSHLMEPMLAEFGQVARGLTYSEPVIPVVTVGDVTDPAYWVDHVRTTVRFHDIVTDLVGRGVTTLLECGPDSTLTGLGRQITDDAAFIGLQHRTREDELLTGLATAWTRGVEVDWKPLLAGGRTVDLPTYAFERQRYWLDGGGADHTDPASMGLTRPGHPLLSAVVTVPGADTTVFTGRLTLGAEGWLADHAVHGSTILPGTAFVELALHAGLHTGAPVLAELVQEAPLPIPDHGGRTLRVVVGPADDGGQRAVGIHTRPDDAAEDDPWTRHAAGFLAPASAVAAADPLTVWPPAGAEPVDVSGLYDELAAAGYGYGPVFRGLRAAWRQGDSVYAEVALPDGSHAEAARFGIHPALLDATMHALSYGGTGAGAEQGATMLPFSWDGVTLLAGGADAVRVRLSPAGPGAVRLTVADTFGAPVATVDSLTLRPVTAAQLSSGSNGSLFTVEWSPAPAAGGTGARFVRVLGAADLDGIDGVDVIVAASGPATGPASVPDRARAAAAEALTLVQAFLGKAELNGTRLIVLTRNAATVPGHDTDPAAAVVWGLLRSAQAEHPGRLILLDSDAEVGDEVLARAAGAAEPELAVRDGQLLAPRLVPAAADTPVEWTPDDVVLITGGTGGLGALLAEHLVRAHGVRKLVLTSRRGPDAPGAPELVARLADLGGQAEAVACDVTDRAALARLLDGVTGIVHAAGVADNALVTDLTPEQLNRVLAPKVDAGWHLHELTADRPLKAFVVLSSAGGLVLAAGQGNYAAANVFLDALAQHRRHHGLTGTSLAYGLWEVSTGLGGDLTDADLDRMRRLGTPALAVADGLALFDAGLASGRANLVPMHVDPVALGSRADDVPVLLRNLARRPRPALRAVAGGRPGGVPLADRLAGLPAEEQENLVLRLVRTHVATVLGHAGADTVEVDRPFKDLGFDSLTAIELRNGLNNATGLRLPATLIFDHPTPRAVMAQLLADLAPSAAPEVTVLDDLARLEAVLTDRPPAPEEQARIAARLRTLAARLGAGPEPEEDAGLSAVSAAELFDILDAELGAVPR